MQSCVYESPIGALLLCADEIGLCSLRVLKQGETAALPEASPVLESACAQLTQYFAGERQSFDLPLSLQVTAFERRVLDALCAIPYGETRSYGEIAEAIGTPGGARAVGRACSRNPVLIIVPCHRVLAFSGALTGFAGGMEAKRWLLEHEGVLLKK